ncbi:IS66 family insertion sequence element accessory protein TnpB [Alishewanella sp. HL-SH05]|uniref:IS66 family insertion sequence element accessory protein TnpB n=1 Tax=Alishewanella sp. HL-SH05 TaxID=3461145 RepID=UPI0040418079
MMRDQSANKRCDGRTPTVFRWIRDVNLGNALWVRRAKGEVNTSAAPMPFLPVSVRAVDAVPVLHKPAAITVSFRSGHQLVLHDATPDMLHQLVVALS